MTLLFPKLLLSYFPCLLIDIHNTNLFDSREGLIVSFKFSYLSVEYIQWWEYIVR